MVTTFLFLNTIIYMKKILLLLTFIIACNFTQPCHANRPFFTGKDNPVPMVIIAAAIAVTGVGIYGIYLFICDKIFGVNNGNINIKYSNNWKFINGNGIKKTKTITLHESFEGIIASDSGNLNIHKSTNDTNTLETTADQNILEYLQPTLDNNTYTIAIETPPNTSINSPGPIIHNLYLNKVTLANLKSFKADNHLKAMLSHHITSNKFKLCANNYAEIDVTFKSLDNLSIDGENYAKIKATGTEIKNLSIDGENHAKITVNGNTEITNATLSNYAEATINTKKLSYDIENYASLTHNRNANIEKQKCSNNAKTITH